MRVLGVTQARGGSKRIHKKNIQELAGKPLIAWTIEQALQSKYLTNYIVSTEDDEIAKLSIENGAVVLPRPEELAADDTPSHESLIWAVKVMEETEGKYDIIADIRCTNPLKEARHIDGMIEYLYETQGNAVIGYGPAYPIERIKRIDKDGMAKDIIHEPSDGQSQFLPESWIRNGSCYVVWRDVLMSHKKLIGLPDTFAYKMPREYSVNIDDELDFALAGVLLKARMR